MLKIQLPTADEFFPLRWPEGFPARGMDMAIIFGALLGCGGTRGEMEAQKTLWPPPSVPQDSRKLFMFTGRDRRLPQRSGKPSSYSSVTIFYYNPVVSLILLGETRIGTRETYTRAKGLGGTMQINSTSVRFLWKFRWNLSNTIVIDFAIP